MARSVLDTSSLGRRTQDTTGQSWARGLTQAASSVAKGLDKRFDIKREEQNKFVNAMDFDVSSVSNDIFKGYAVNEMDKIRENWGAIFKEQKGWLTPEQKIKMQSDLNGFQKSVEYLNSMSQTNDAAMQAAQKDPRMQYNADGWGQVIDLFNKDEIDPDAIRNAGSMFMQSDTGVPGTSYIGLGVEDAFVGSAPGVAKPENRISGGIETKTEGNEKFESGYQEYGYPTNDTLEELVYNDWDKKGILPLIDKRERGNLTPEEQEQAILQFGDQPGSFAKYSLYNKVPPEVKDEFKTRRKYESWTRVPQKADPATKTTARDKRILNLFQAEGRPVKTEFGVRSENFVDWSDATPSDKSLTNLILDEGTEELVIQKGESHVQTFAGAGKPQSMKIVGHDRDRGVFYLADSRTRLKEGESPWEAKVEEAHLVMVPEEVVMQAKTGQKPGDEMLSMPTKEMPTEEGLRKAEIEAIQEEGYSTEQINQAAKEMYQAGFVTEGKGRKKRQVYKGEKITPKKVEAYLKEQNVEPENKEVKPTKADPLGLGL